MEKNESRLRVNFRTEPPSRPDFLALSYGSRWLLQVSTPDSNCITIRTKLWILAMPSP